MTRRRCLWFLCIGSLSVLPITLHGQTADEVNERNTVTQQAIALVQQGKYKEAVPGLERAVELSIRVFGADDPRTMSTQGMLGQMYFIVGDPAKAEALYLRGVMAQEKLKGKTSAEVAHSLCYLGFRFHETRDLPKAEDYLVRGIKTWEAIPEAQRQDQYYDYPAALTTLGRYCQARGDFTKAEALLLRSRKIWDAGRARDTNNSLANLMELAGVYHNLGEYSKAELLMNRSIKTRTAQGESQELAGDLEQLARLYMTMGQPPQAEPILRRALKIHEKTLGSDHPRTASSLQGLGALYRQLKKHEEAEACYARALKILEAKYGADSPELYFVLQSSAILEYYRKNYQKSLTICQHTLKLAETKFGADHPYTATVLYDMADDYRQLGEPAKAEAVLARALKIRETSLGVDHPETANVRGLLACQQAGSGRWDEAMDNFDRVRRGHRRYIARALPGLSAAQQLAFLENARNSVGFSSALAAAMVRASEPKTVALAAEWLLNGKAIGQQALAEHGQEALASADPAQRKLLQQLRAVRGQLANLTLVAPKPGQEAAYRKELERLAASEQELAKSLGLAMGRPSRDDPWVRLDEVRHALPADGVLIEISEFFFAEFKSYRETLRGEPHFVAWVIPAAGKGEVKLVDLGLSKPIEEAVAALSKALKESPKSIIAKGEAEAEQELRKTLQPLAKLILEPLHTHIGGKKHWILSPDTDLWLVPWAALPLPDGSYAVEKHTISYVISGRDLATPSAKAPVKRDPPLVMADPDFDIEPNEVSALTVKLLGRQTPPEGSLDAILNGPVNLRAAAGVGRVNRLPGTAAEAVAIKPKLQAYTGEEPWVYRGKNALEAVFKAWHSPRVVVLSTHGYFFPDDKKGGALANPLLRCGLLLAGCNERGKAAGAQEDGVLTGLEIVGSDLRGTELVVLSACETGVGDLRSGEGISGLRQAFQLAGAQTVVSSLWQVADRDTALLMSDFFDSLARGKGKAEALREAQLARIKAHQDRDGAAHPFFWAAFTITGK